MADAAVIPSPDEEPGKCPRRAWCLRALVSEAQLQAFVAARVASYKKVRRLEVVDVDQSPKPPSGKLHASGTDRARARLGCERWAPVVVGSA